MTIPNYKHLARAKMVATHRKEFLGGLVAVVLLGGILGYVSGPFFAQFLETDPNHPGFPIGTWEATREIFLASMTFFGVLIWPIIFVGCYFVLRRRSGKKLAAKIAIYDEEARDARIAETERKIIEAQKRGEI